MRMPQHSVESRSIIKTWSYSTFVYYSSMIKYDLLHITIFFGNNDLIDYAQQASLHKI